ncbi:MAG TPA: hypothetical protein VHP58_03320 [Alphaproteobacteria bacterium]|nr:hypothetical protein [Alphaproteobacteria bacterium]
MKFVMALLVLVGLTATAHAKVLPPRDAPVAAELPLFTDIPTAENIRTGTVTAELGLLSENPKWEMRSTAVPVLVRLISDSTVRMAKPTDNLWKQVKPAEPAYKGLTLRLRMANGQPMQSLRFYNGKVTTESGHLLLNDPGRYLEFWLFGTARIKRDQVLAGRALPIISFDQCRMLGNAIVETTPRQCLLPDNGIMLETDEAPTSHSLKAVDFDTCLKYGQSLIYTFPRRCVAKGGRVFTEPPRVYEAADAIGVSVSTVTGVSATTPDRKVKKAKADKTVSGTEVVSGTAVIEDRPGLGLYAVSPAVPHGVSPVEVAVSATVPVSLSITLSSTVPVVTTPTLVVSPVMTMPVSTTADISAVAPVAAVTPTVPVSNFEVTLGPVKK